MQEETQTRHDEIRKFVEQSFLFEFGKDADDNTNLFEAGLMDSYGFVEFIAYLEQTYDIFLSEEDLVSGDIASFSGLLGLIDTKLANQKTAD